MNQAGTGVEVFQAGSPPGLKPHGDLIDSSFIKGNMGGLVVIKLRAGELEMHSHAHDHALIIQARAS